MGITFPARVQSKRRIVIPPDRFGDLDAEEGDYVTVTVDDFEEADDD